MAAIDDSHLKCSFCGKTQEQVKKLIAGPDVYICDECVELCNEILDEEFLENKDKPEDKEIKETIFNNLLPSLVVDNAKVKDITTKLENIKNYMISINKQFQKNHIY